MPYCSSFLYRLLRGVPITSAVFEMFQPFSRSLPTRNARSDVSLNSRSVPFSPSGPPRGLGLKPDDVAQVVDVDDLGRRHDDQPLDGVLQLADVALPARALQVLERRRREALRPPVVVAAEQVGEVLDQRRDVLAAIAQRRHADRDHAEAEVEILAERALLDLLLEVLVGRGDDADVDLDRPRRSEALDFALLQHAQDLGLRLRAHVADFVEEDRAAVGLLELADLLLGRAGERALLVAEQLRLDQLLRESPRS